LPDKSALQVLYTILFILTAASVFIGVFLGNRLPVWLSMLFERTGGYYILLFVYIVAAVLIGDLLRIINHYFQFFPTWITTHYAQVKLMYFAAVIGFILIIVLIGNYRFVRPEIREMTFAVNNNENQLENLTIVAASDLHMGNVIRGKRLRKWVTLINSQKPDLILLVGDIFDHNYQTVVNQQMNKELEKLESKYGTYAVPGNHDYYTGLNKVIPYLEQAGIKVLRDSAVNINDRIVIVGRDDRTNAERKTLTGILNSQNGHLPVVVIDHQPQGYMDSVNGNVYLHLSGHTHDGQIFPYNKIVKGIYELAYGYKKINNTHVYVSSGLGLWGAPLRIGTQSEIIKIHLK